MIGKRITDHRLQRLILRLLQGGILKDGIEETNREGTPQGGLATPQTQLTLFPTTL